MPITLTLAEWNIVLNALAQRPYAEVAEVIQNIHAQAKPQIETPNDSKSI